ncbi:exo-beta-N-acetylmuramidase NamZ domain-containing protein [Humisphaera borealis]|uniref:DUF1343 domain-containing protein n=1 Tax=Humisphaera borealis TaxID=2807512 RepID=A0A7M2X0T7_9BACT|nr:exo-beta-N-acetylmuramidase NamZ domain-containing protein [Humisphaera borealis]QOV91357.1 DUF1343 domain-containing protein [Humisphaera borealis]
MPAHRIHANAKIPSLLLVVGVLLAGCRGGAEKASSQPLRQPLPQPEVTTRPAFDQNRMADADRAITDAIGRGEIPGAVLVVGRGDRTGGTIIYKKAYGNRAVQPASLPMATDTLFDMASLSKPMGCASSVMVLIERGRIDPNRPVATYLPEFGQNGKDKITVAQLLLHQGGLIPDNALADYQNSPAVAWEKICSLKPQTPAGTAFKYTDVGYIVLGKLVEKVSGQSLNDFARENIFEPAGMTSTGYLPPPDRKQNAAPTEQREGRWMIGEVHDPRAYLLGGVAGHAGLFSTADDTGRFCRMLLNGGTIDGRQVFKPSTVALMTRPQSLPDGTNLRTFGFDCDTAYSSPRGERFPKGVSFGHTGFTGTSLWIDPVNDSFVVLLTNSVHPNGKGKATPLRRQIGTIAAEALLGPQPGTSATATPAAESTGPVATGIDVLAQNGFAPLRGKRVALVTNQTGIDRRGRRTVDLLAAADGVKLVKLFSPEHGLFGMLDDKVSDMTDPKTGLHVYSLYGKTRKPTPEMMAGVDTLVFDIQDAGARYYTYVSTMGLCMEACAAARVTMVVLDRPNPTTGNIVDGPIADDKSLNFVGYAPIPVSHGMTVGELAKMYNLDRKIGCDLQVIEMTGWRRDLWFDQTGLTWINPSPNLRSPTQALLYLGIGQIEMTNVSVGRGTDFPFEVVAAPWIDAEKLSAALTAEKLPGLSFAPITFTPTASKFANTACFGVRISVTDRTTVEPVKLGTALAWHLRRLGGDTFEIDKVNVLLKSEATIAAIKSAKTPSEIASTWPETLAAFRATRAKYLIYR